MNGYGQDIETSKFNGNSGGSVGGMLAVPKQAPLMDVSMRVLGQQIERLQQAVQLLCGKLEPVLYAEPPSPATTRAVEASGPRASSNLGSSINSYADQIESVTDRVNAMIRRCEL